MIIRSQDKRRIETFNNAFVCSCDVYVNGIPFGEYSTEEKAIKVLDMICNFADEKYYEKIVTEKCDYIGGVVFNMPQDSEV